MADKNSGKSLITGRESLLAKKKREKERERKREAAIKRERKRREKEMWEEMESTPDRSSQKSYTRRGGPKVGADEMFRQMNK